MKLSIYVLKQKELDYDYCTEWKNISTTTCPHTARKWKFDVGSIGNKRDFDRMQVQIPDDMVWE